MEIPQFIRDLIEAEWRYQLSKLKNDICREVAEYAQVALLEKRNK